MVLTPPLEPMLARSVDALPGRTALPGGTVYEPKYDGYRLLVFAGRGSVLLQSRNRRDLTASFPEISAAAEDLAEDVVVDGEAVIYRDGRLDFGALQQRISRKPATAARLSQEQPAHLIAFDLLYHAGTDLTSWPYRERRAELESLFQRRNLQEPWSLTPITYDPDQARVWMRQWAAVGVEGVVAKGQDQPYQPGRRGWLKYRHRDTAEAIIGAITGTLARPEAVLLGRYTADGELHLVARSTPLTAALRRELAALLKPAAPLHPWHGMRISSHWGSRDPLDFTPTAPELILEFYGDTAVDQGRWRHPVRAHRLRPDLSPNDVPARLPTGSSSAGAPQSQSGGEMPAKEPKRTVYHVTAVSGRAPDQKWQIEHKEGRRQVREPHRTQRQAIDAAREQAKQHQPAQVIVHGRDGRIRTAYTYGHDPRRTPG